MKLNLDLRREILLQIEASPATRGYIQPSIPSYSEEEIAYHKKLLRDEGLVEANDLSDHSGHDWGVIGLTASGHKCLDTIRDQRGLATTKEVAKRTV